MDKEGIFKGFFIVGVDKVFYWVQARIVGDKVIVYCLDVEEFVVVRYVWADNLYYVNLYNQEGFFVFFFWMDDWLGIIIDKIFKL